MKRIAIVALLMVGCAAAPAPAVGVVEQVREAPGFSEAWTDAEILEEVGRICEEAGFVSMQLSKAEVRVARRSC